MNRRYPRRDGVHAVEGPRKNEEIVRRQLVEAFVEIALVDQAAGFVEDHYRKDHHGRSFGRWAGEKEVGTEVVVGVVVVN